MRPSSWTHEESCATCLSQYLKPGLDMGQSRNSSRAHRVIHDAALVLQSPSTDREVQRVLSTTDVGMVPQGVPSG